MVDKHKHSGVFIRMPDDLIKKLEEEAESRMVSKTWLASRLVIEGLRSLKPVDAPWLTHEPEPDKQDTTPRVKLPNGYTPCPENTDGFHSFNTMTGICVRCGMTR
jgi:hypothetical protein